MVQERLIGHTYGERITIPAVNTRVRFRDNFNMKKLYTIMHDWFIEEGWVKRDDSIWPEHYFLLRETQWGNEMWIWWRFKKVPSAGEGGSGTNNYYRYLLDVFWHIMGAKDVEVMHQGKKFKTNNADLEVVIQSRLEMDYKHEDGKGWRDHAILKHFNEVFHKRFFQGKLQIQKHMLFRETYRLQEVVKNFLGMKMYMPEKEGQEFWPKYGLGDTEGLEGL